MNLTQHAHVRSSQRCISIDELSILQKIGIEEEQKGGTFLITISKSEKQQWVIAIKEALIFLNDLDNAGRTEIRKKRKVLKRFLEKLSAKNMPYYVENGEENKVITCGHYQACRFRRN